MHALKNRGVVRVMKNSKFDRRKFLLGSGMCVIAISQYQFSYATRLQNAVTRFIDENYSDSLDEMTDEEINDVAREIPEIESRLASADRDLRNHIEESWGDEDSQENIRHTEKCPYCNSLATEVQSRIPELDPVENKIPRCFVINNAGYVSSDWGSLHRYFNGNIGPVEGSIWFKNGTYMARNAFGGLQLALPHPAC